MGCGTPICDGITDACIDLRIGGEGSFSALDVEWTIASTPLRTARTGQLDNALALPRELRLLPPPQATPQSLRVLSLNLREAESCSLSADEISCTRGAASLLWNGEPLIDGTTGLPLADGEQLHVEVQPFLFRQGAMSDLVEPYTQFLAADLDGDSQAEIIINYASQNVGLLRRDADGLFREYGRAFSGSGAQTLSLGDVDGDGHVDLLITALRAINVLPGRADGSFGTPRVLTTPWDIGATSVGNTDGIVPNDIVATELYTCGMTLPCRTTAAHLALWRNGQSTSTITALPSVAGTTPTHYVQTAVAPLFDVTGDGLVDLIAFDDAENAAVVFKGDATAPLSTSVQWPQIGALSLCNVFSADFTRDGQPDLLGSACDPPFGFFMLDHPTLGMSPALVGRFPTGATHTMAVDDRQQSAAVADLSGDGRPDVALTDGRMTNRVALLAGRAGGVLAPAAFFEALEPATSVLSADVNGDGRPDLLIAHQNSRRISVLYNYAR